jgi:putative alpha-1,2-mannosidase
MSYEYTLPRRRFLKGCTAAFAAAAASGTLAELAFAESTQDTTSSASGAAPGNLRFVRPVIGTGWRGHMFPGAVVPFGLVQLSPDTSGGPEPKWNIQGDWYGWGHCSGYHFPDNVINGFSHTHVQGTGGGDLGDVLLMPVVEGKNWSWDAGTPPPLAEMQAEFLGPDSGWVFDSDVAGYRSFFSHEQEVCRPGYYSVFLQTPGVKAELTATTRCGMHRYSYSELPADVGRGILLDLVHALESKVYHAELKVESATRISGMRGTNGWAHDKQVYFVIEFSQPAKLIEMNVDGTMSPASPGAKVSGKEIKSILSFAPNAKPLSVRVGISCTSVDGASKNLAAEIPHWDFDAVAKETAGAWEIVRTMLADYRQLGKHALPMWPLWGNETWSMTGFHAAGMILGAYTRGFRGFDAEEAYAAIRDTAMNGAEGHGRELQADFREYGYVPMELHGGGVSCTLDLSYDYWCAGAMAELLGKHDDAAMFYKLGQNYRNVYDASTGFMRGKSKDGTWRSPFRPDQEYDDYVETDAWQASFSVPHDVQGLIDLHGGDAPFIAKLEGLFTAPSLVLESRPDITGMVGQDAQGNEPSNHNAYLFPFAGAAWKTQYWVRKVAALYRNTPAGIPGNDDCGQTVELVCICSAGILSRKRGFRSVRYRQPAGESRGDTQSGHEHNIHHHRRE